MYKKWAKKLRRLLCRQKGGHHPTYKFRMVTVQPAVVRRHVLYILSHQGCHWEILLQCPCGCGEILHVNLLEEIKPFWKYRVDKCRKVTLFPSLHRKVGCRSHFFIRKGKVVWV